MSRHNIPDPGYALYRRTDPSYNVFEVFVPYLILASLAAEDERKRLEKEAADEEAEKTRRNANAERRESVVRLGSQKASGLQEKENQKDKELEAEQGIWDAIAAKDADVMPTSGYSVFTHQEALQLHSRAGLSESDEKNRQLSVYRKMVEKGTAKRQLARLESLDSLNELERKQSHMKEVTRFVREQLQLAQLSSKPMRLQPMLLVGEPGVGKTHFAQALAAALETTIHIQQLDSDLTNSFLLGSDRKWSNSQHGLLFELLVLGKHANPVIVLDEIDKTQRNVSYGSPIQGLYSVLEPLSAQRVRDISLLFEFDASQVTWIATANDVTRMEPALRSRFKEFHILPPSAQECLVLAEEVMRSVVESVGVEGFTADFALKRHLAHLPARQIWQLTREAMGRAVASERRHLQATDFPEWLIEAEAQTHQSPPIRMH